MLTRILTALGVLVSGGVHLWLWFDGFRDVDVIGPSFMFNAVAGLVIAVAVIVWRHWLPLLLAVGFGTATLLAFLISTTVGLFGLHEVFWGTWQMLAAASELLAIVAGCVALWRENHTMLTKALATRRSEGGLHAHPR
ncbi:MAG TPA: hypothetical protein VFG63_02300 [Nocardioidaceae bacterium]|nr:hypothetical protein [Nocardioidaceae bacterium]